MNGSTTLAAVLQSVPCEWKRAALSQEIRQLLGSSRIKVAVLDDDPTGVQTVHGIYVLTQWDEESLLVAMEHPSSSFFILTNTRGMDASEAERINREIARNLFAAARKSGIRLRLISRSDSTLRGHYPLETDTLAEVMECMGDGAPDGHLIVPAFFESGRYTFGNIHYMQEDGRLVPVGQTEFAGDPVFGFRTSDLRSWVQEKSDGTYPAAECAVLTIEDIRQGPEQLAMVLRRLSGNRPVIINALSYADLEVVAMACHQVEAEGKRLLYRSAASFVKSYCGVSDKPLLETGDLYPGLKAPDAARTGLILVGSFVLKSTSQLRYLLSAAEVESIELRVDLLLERQGGEREIEAAVYRAEQAIRGSRSVVVYTSRDLVKSDQREHNVRISQLVSAALVAVVRRLEYAPDFIVAKGGITSSDIATKGLGIRKAMVLGQVEPGVPVWQTSRESKFPGIPYVVFPGNVGQERTLWEVFRKLSK